MSSTDSSRPTHAFLLGVNNTQTWQDEALSVTRDAIARAIADEDYLSTPEDERESFTRTRVAASLERWADSRFDAALAARRRPHLTLAAWLDSEVGKLSQDLGPLVFIDWRAVASDFMVKVSEEV